MSRDQRGSWSRETGKGNPRHATPPPPPPPPACSPEPTPRTEADLPVAYRGTAWQALTRTGQHDAAPVVHLALRCWATGVEHDTEWVETGTGDRRPLRSRAWVTMTTEHGETFRVPAEHPVVVGS